MKAVYPVIAEINEYIALTTLGICKLMAFDEAVVTRSFKVLKESDKVRKPWSFLMKLCIQFSQEQHRSLNWDLVAQMCKSLGVDSNGDEVEFEGFRKDAPLSSSSNGKIERPEQFDTSSVVRDLSHEDPYDSACMFFNNLKEDTVTDKGVVITSEQKIRVTKAQNPYWSILSPEQRETLRSAYDFVDKYPQTGKTLLDTLNE